MSRESKDCPYRMNPMPPPRQQNALHVEAILPSSSCELKPRKDQGGRLINVARYVCSGGDPSAAAYPCHMGECPLEVPADAGNYFQTWTGACPFCGTLCALKSPGRIKCEECGKGFELIDPDEAYAMRLREEKDAMTCGVCGQRDARIREGDIKLAQLSGYAHVLCFNGCFQFRQITDEELKNAIEAQGERKRSWAVK